MANPLTSQEAQTEESALIDAVCEAAQDLISFRQILLTTGADEVDPAPFHMTWSDILLHGKKNYAIEGFRESAKGQIVIRSFLLYCLAFPDETRDYIVLVKQNGDLAEAKLKEIEEEYLTNPALNGNIAEVKQKSAKVFSVDVRSADDPDKIINVRIEAYGKGASIRGLDNQSRRPRIVVIDDPQDLEDSLSETTLKNDWLWFLDDVKFLGQHSRIFLIGNNLGEKCIIERVFANKADLNFETMKIGIILPPDETHPDPHSAWPAKYSIEEIEAERESFRRMGQLDVWMRERMCEAIDEESRMITRADLDMRYSPVYLDSFIHSCNIFATLDPASSEDKSACYRAIVVNAVRRTPAGQVLWFILEIRYGRWAPDILMNQIFEVVSAWHPMTFGIEKGMIEQIMGPWIRQEQLRRNIMFHVTPIEHMKKGSKLERCKMLGPRFKAKGIWLPESAPWLAEFESEALGVTKDGFKSLFTDLIDATAMQDQIAVPPTNSSEQHRNARIGGGDPRAQITEHNPLTGRKTGSILHRPGGDRRYQ